MRFVDPARQGRFRSPAADLADVPLLEVTTAMDQGRVRLNGEPYSWEADEWCTGSQCIPPTAPRSPEERGRSHFTLLPAGQ
jgi:hypothetical protein